MRKKFIPRNPPITEAIQFTGQPIPDLKIQQFTSGFKIWNDTHELWLSLSVGDYIYWESGGGPYIMNDDTFMTYYKPLEGGDA